jgi:hypothetical protein
LLSGIGAASAEYCLLERPGLVVLAIPANHRRVEWKGIRYYGQAAGV